ncbi:8-amino-7-oxononanoate synthase, partial [Aspergillus sp. HF37]
MNGQEILSQKLQSALERRYHDGRLIEPPSPAALAEMVDFGSNDTLSLSSSGALTQTFLSQLRKNPDFRVGSTSTRIFEGTTQYLKDLEHDLAQLHGAETALFFNSGYDANVAIWSTIPQPGDFILHDEYVHASIHDGMRRGRATTISFPHNDCDGFRRCLQNLRDEHYHVAEGNALVFVSLESFYSMDGDSAPVQEMVHTAGKTLPRQNVVFSIDEAHSNGLVGPNGSGFVCYYGMERQFALRLHTYGKAFSSHG